MPEDKNQNGLRERVNFGLLQVVRAESLTPVKCKSRGICLPLTAIFFDRELTGLLLIQGPVQTPNFS